MTPELYARAERLLLWNLKDVVRNLDVKPHWTADRSRFWYRRGTEQGKEFVLVDPGSGERGPAFDHARLSRALSEASGAEYGPHDLPFDSFEFVDGLDAIRFDVDGVRWSCALDSYGCQRTGTDAAGEGDLLSPDGRRNVIVRDHDIYVRSTHDGSELRLTHDGQPYHDYATRPESYTTAVTDRLSGKALQPLAAWSPDSRKLVTHRLDQREVDSLHLVQSVGLNEGARPVPAHLQVRYGGRRAPSDGQDGNPGR